MTMVHKSFPWWHFHSWAAEISRIGGARAGTPCNRIVLPAQSNSTHCSCQFEFIGLHFLSQSIPIIKTFMLCSKGKEKSPTWSKIPLFIERRRSAWMWWAWCDRGRTASKKAVPKSYQYALLRRLNKCNYRRKDEAASSRKASKVLLYSNNSLNRSVRSGPNLAYSFYRKSTSFVSASAISSTLLGSSTWYMIWITRWHRSQAV